jgi:hypothetical protein
MHSFGSHGFGKGNLQEPWGIAVSREGNIIVTEGANNHRVQVFGTAS